MNTEELKSIVEALTKCSEEFGKQHELFEEYTMLELEGSYDKFQCAICDCKEVLAQMIGIIEVENITRKEIAVNRAYPSVLTKSANVMAS